MRLFEVCPSWNSFHCFFLLHLLLYLYCQYIATVFSWVNYYQNSCVCWIEIGNPDWFYFQLHTDANVIEFMKHDTCCIYDAICTQAVLFPLISCLPYASPSAHHYFLPSFGYVQFYSFSHSFIWFYLACSLILSLHSVSEKEMKWREIAGNCFRSLSSPLRLTSDLICAIIGRTNTHMCTHNTHTVYLTLLIF